MRDYEYAAIAASRISARAAARMMAVRARMMLVDAERVLEAAELYTDAKLARDAGEATTTLMAAVYDGNEATFACKR